MLNSKGFTLIEMLLVLSIIMMTSAFSLKYHIPDIDTKKYIDQISDFIYEAKMNAIVTKEKTEIRLYDSCLKYRSRSNQSTLEMDGVVYCSSYEFSFNENGNIYKAKTISYWINGEKIDFVFQVGSGCFEVRG